MTAINKIICTGQYFSDEHGNEAHRATVKLLNITGIVIAFYKPFLAYRIHLIHSSNPILCTWLLFVELNNTYSNPGHVTLKHFLNAKFIHHKNTVQNIRTTTIIFTFIQNLLHAFLSTIFHGLPLTAHDVWPVRGLWHPGKGTS